MHECEECGARFGRRDHFVRHGRVHSEAKQYVCVCGRKYKSKENLIIHERVHSGERPYECECDRRFKSSTALLIHREVHSGKYDCCGRSFGGKGALSAHRRRHSGVYPYRCKVCNMGAHSAAGLKIHERVHGDECFVCGVCGKEYKSVSGMRDHRRVHEGPYCPVCMRAVRTAGACGYCAQGYRHGDKERAVFLALFAHDSRFESFVRDRSLGCGTRRRPDAYADLYMSCGRVMFVIEVDEFEHRSNSVECEKGRLQEIQDRHGGALYVLRVNPDGGGLERFMQRCVEVLDGDYAKAQSAFGGVLVEYFNYGVKRLRELGAGAELCAA